jgi:hypothetical protein
MSGNDLKGVKIHHHDLYRHPTTHDVKTGLGGSAGELLQWA